MSEEQKELSVACQSLGDWTRTHTCGGLTGADNGAEVCLMGWVQYRRDHGGLIFVDLRDRFGLTQIVFSPEYAPEAHEQAGALRSRTAMAIRNELASQGFLEVETPILTKSTPEGARDYLVPSRLNHGQFYALPQSPQQFKQFCMIAGLDRYFQIARCFRDEDLRADRQPEFTQVDIEMSFADEKQVMDMAEGLMIRVFKEALGADIPAPFPRMTWDEAMSRYGVDKPDTRFGLELQDVTSIVSNSGFKLFASAKLVKAMRVPGGESLTRKEIDELTEFVKIYGAQGLAWIKIRENEWQSPIAKFLSDEERAGLTEALGLSVGDIVFFQAGEPGMVNAALGNLRVHLGESSA